jgi:hypothetical protein
VLIGEVRIGKDVEGSDGKKFYGITRAFSWRKPKGKLRENKQF